MPKNKPKADDALKYSTALVVVSSRSYNDLVIENAKRMSGKRVVYITLNKTFSSMKEIFGKNDVDYGKFVFIDAISKSIKDVEDSQKGCYFIRSPGDLTEMSILLIKILSAEFDYIVFDAVTNLLTYQTPSNIVRFLSNTVARINENKANGVFYALKEQEKEQIVQEASMFVEKVIERQ